MDPGNYSVFLGQNTFEDSLFAEATSTLEQMPARSCVSHAIASLQTCCIRSGSHVLQQMSEHVAVLEAA